MSKNKEASIERLMAEAMIHYGNCCRYCGEVDARVLTITPGGEHGLLQQLHYLSSRNWPERDPEGKSYIVLCLNCRKILALNGGS